MRLPTLLGTCCASRVGLQHDAMNEDVHASSAVLVGEVSSQQKVVQDGEVVLTSSEQKKQGDVTGYSLFTCPSFILGNRNAS